MRALLTGKNGMLGSAIAEQWAHQRPDDQLRAIGRDDVDLRDRPATARLLAEDRPDVVIHAAAKVGGIMAKIEHPTTYLLDNLLIDTSVIAGAIEARVPNLLYIGSAAVYPEHYRQPFVETDLLAGPLEAANEGYAIAKLAAIKLCSYASSEFGLAYRTAIPSNLYGPNDDYSLERGHLIAAAVAKVHLARLNDLPSVEVWGDGTVRREFTYVGDVAHWLTQQADRLRDWPAVVNVGAGTDLSIAEYYAVARRVVGWDGEFAFDPSKPSGMQQRIMDSTAASRLGWKATTSIGDGMAEAYRRFTNDPTRRKAS